MIALCENTYKHERRDFMSKTSNDGTFVVKIKYKENATWQGSVHWVNQNVELPFRSALELIKLMDSAMEGKIELVEKNS